MSKTLFYECLYSYDDEIFKFILRHREKKYSRIIKYKLFIKSFFIYHKTL